MGREVLDNAGHFILKNIAAMFHKEKKFYNLVQYAMQDYSRKHTV